MDYTLFTPSPHLAPYLRCYWTLDQQEVPLPAAKERIFPDGCMELLFDYGDLFLKHTDTHSFLQPQAFLHGQLKSFIDVEPTGTIGVFSVRFQPHGLRAFTNTDVSVYTEKVVPIEELWGAAGTQLGRQIAAAADTAERIRLTEAFLEERLHPESSQATLVARAVERLERVSGMYSIDSLAAELCVGRRHFERVFLEHVGLSPKLLARILRFNTVLKLIERQEWNTLTTIAQDSGFYDQAHFIRDFKSITGLNPTTYFADVPELVRFFHLAK